MDNQQTALFGLDRLDENPSRSDGRRETPVQPDPVEARRARPPKEKTVWRPMTSEEQRMVYALSLCSFLPASFDKRFARQLRLQCAQGVVAPEITDRQAVVLRQKIRRYRRQIRARELPASEQHLLAKRPS